MGGAYIHRRIKVRYGYHAITVRRLVPLLSWLPAYRAAWLSADLIAGVTIWGLLIPEAIAYAGLAGLPPQAGLYTLLASLGLYAIFGSSRHLVVAPTSASAVLLAAAVGPLHPKDPAAHVSLAAALVLLVGVLLLASGILRLGFITEFLSRPVMAGFVFGLAIFITVGQVPKLFGIEKNPGDAVRQFIHLMANLGHTSGSTLAVGAGALALLFLLDRFAPRVPGGLSALVLGLGASVLLHLSSHGVAVVGAITAGLPSAGLPHVEARDLLLLLPGAAGMVLVLFSEGLSAADTFAEKHDYEVDVNQDMIALGLANIGAGVLGGMAPSGSMSQTAVNDGAGARSQMSPIVAAVLALVTVLALTPLFKELPEAVLAALIIHAVSHLMRVRVMRRFYRLQPSEFWLGMLTLAGVLVFDVLPGLVIGVVVSLVRLVFRDSRAHLSVLGGVPGVPGAYGSVERHAQYERVPGVLIVRLDGPLFYANAKTFRDRLQALAAEHPADVRSVVVDLHVTESLDITAAEMLEKLIVWLHKRGVRMAFAQVHSEVQAMARRAGIANVLGEDRVFPTVDAAVHWAQSHPMPRT